MYRVAHPVGDHGVQNFMPGGAGLAGQQVACVDDGARRELDAHCPADHLELVHDVEHPLPGGVVLDNQVDTVAVHLAAGHQDVPRERGEDVNPSVAAEVDDLIQSRIHGSEEDAGGDGQVADHVVLAILEFLDGTDGTICRHVHETGVVPCIDHDRRVRFGDALGLQKPLDDVDVGGGQGPAAGHHVHRRSADVVERHAKSPCIAASHHDDGHVRGGGGRLVHCDDRCLPVDADIGIQVPFIDTVKPLKEGGVERGLAVTGHGGDTHGQIRDPVASENLITVDADIVGQDKRVGRVVHRDFLPLPPPPQTEARM